MACNSCMKTFSLLRKERGCPNCGFSYCSTCLNNKSFVEKLQSEAKVCKKCFLLNAHEPKQIVAPDAYYKRINRVDTDDCSSNDTDKVIQQRLNSLKADSKPKRSLEDEIDTKLQKLKDPVPTTSDTELYERLAKLKGTSYNPQQKNVLPAADIRSEEEQVNDLMKQYMGQVAIDAKYKDEFDEIVNNIDARLQKLKEPSSNTNNAATSSTQVESEDEEETIAKIVEKAKAESSLDINPSHNVTDELPFCEICNEDARMRCLGCNYLFCKRCFLEHKDEDDGCDKYEPYTPPDETRL